MSPHRIDVHHHFLPPGYVDTVGEARIGPIILSARTPEWSPGHSLAAMERNGISAAVLSISAPGIWFGDPAETRRLARLCNEYGAQLKRDNPGRFGLFACLPLPDIDASLAEIDHAFGSLDADGIGLLTSCDDEYPGAPVFAPVFEELNRRKAIVYFHPTAPLCSKCLPHIPAATLEFPFDTTRAITSLLFGGTFARSPDIRFVFSHAGGAVPFLAERIGRLPAARPELREKVPDGVVATLQRLWYDTALSANQFAFRSLLELVPPAKVLFGSDYPFAPEPTMAATIAGLAGLGLSTTDLRAIERDNALGLFPGLR